MKLKKIYKYYPSHYDHIANDLTLNYVDMDGKVFTKIIPGLIIKEYLLTRFANFHFFDGKGRFEEDGRDISNRLAAAWDLFSRTNLTELSKIAYAMDINYRPLDNYDKNSTITETDKDRKSVRTGTITSNDGMSTKTNQYNSQTSEQREVETKDNVASFDVDSTNESTTVDRTLTPTINSHGGNDIEINEQNVDRTETFDNLTDTKNGATETTEYTHGNIGVTTSSAMLNEYLRMRTNCNIYEYIVNLYADKFLYC